VGKAYTYLRNEHVFVVVYQPCERTSFTASVSGSVPPPLPSTFLFLASSFLLQSRSLQPFSFLVLLLPRFFFLGKHPVSDRVKHPVSDRIKHPVSVRGKHPVSDHIFPI